MKELLTRIRPVTDADNDLPVFSYSRLDSYRNCPMQYQLKYIDGKYSEDTTPALELGNLLHYVLEQKGKMIRDGADVEYDKLYELMMNGVTDTNNKTKQPLAGISELKRKYADDWYKPDDASGMNYEQKLSVFDTVLHTEMDNSEWTPVLFEHEFRFVWDNRIVIHGFIDRIDRRGNELRTVDYKTSKKPFYSRDLASSLQFGIYAMAILNEFGVLPVESVYRLILIDKAQYALTGRWTESLIKELDNLLDNIDNDTQKNVFVPKPIALCYWCNYCRQNSYAIQYKNECEYFLKWTPDNKTREVNKPWGIS